MFIYLILTIPFAILGLWFTFRSGSKRHGLDWFSSLWLAVFAVISLFLLMSETEVAVEEKTADIDGIILTDHNVSQIIGINSMEHLFPAFGSDATFSTNRIMLKNRKPTAEQAGKLIYRIVYRYKKYFG